MKFYNRERELEKLTQIIGRSKHTAHMMVITGRRRVGKTELMREFSRRGEDILYLFVSKKKAHVLLEEFQEVISQKIPIIKSLTFIAFDDFFEFLFNYMTENHHIVVFDEFQNFTSIDPAIFSILQKHWDSKKDSITGSLIFIGSVFTLMKNIFENEKEPLFGRVTSQLYLEQFTPKVIAGILEDYNLDPSRELLFYYTLFGGFPKYYFLLDRYGLFDKSREEIIKTFFTEQDAILQNEGRELLIEEFGKNYYLYFSILQVIAGGETQMARIADNTGININSISKYLDELISYYQVLDRKLPVTEHRTHQKTGRYYIKDPFLKFWFRYIFKNLSMIEIGDEKRLTNKIISDLPNLMGFVFENVVKEFLRELNLKQKLPFRFTKMGSYWNRTGSVEVDIVAIDDEKDRILFGECKLSSSKMGIGVINKLKSRAKAIDWRREKREEYFAVFTADEIEANTKKAFEGQGIVVYSLKDLILSFAKIRPYSNN
jgi:AAA+ ATPase superfamily predicted ATPase